VAGKFTALKFCNCNIFASADDFGRERLSVFEWRYFFDLQESFADVYGIVTQSHFMPIRLLLKISSKRFFTTVYLLSFRVDYLKNRRDYLTSLHIAETILPVHTYTVRNISSGYKTF